MIKFNELEIAFKDLKEELNKGMSSPNGQIPNVGMIGGGGTPQMGTSGGQGGMYRSEDMDKNCAPPAAMNMSDNKSSDMKKQMIGASPGGAQDAMMIKYDANGQWRMEKASMNVKPGRGEGGKVKGVHTSVIPGERAALGTSEAGARMRAPFSSPYDIAHAKLEHEKVLSDIKSMPAPKLGKTADEIIEKLEKHYISQDGKNREANPKLRQSDMGPGGKVHMIKKDEGTNSEAASSKPHNKEKFKVMPMTSEKEEKHADAKGLPYDGKDKDVKKGEECPKCKQDPCKCMDKSQIGHIQGNDVKGNDENKAPGRGTLAV